MPVPESSVISPEAELIDPEWSNCLPAQKYLEALVAYHNGEIGIDEIGAIYLEMARIWMKLDGRKRKNLTTGT